MGAIYDNDDYENDGFVTMKRWLENRNAGKNFNDYFKDCGYTKIAIYGAGDLGRLLYQEIKDTEIEILWFADRNGEGIHEIDGIPVVTIEKISSMPEVDILVITPVGNYDAISSLLAKVIPQARTLSLREAVYEF